MTWTLDLAEGWHAEWDEGVYTVTRPDGVGALQVSGSRKKDGAVQRADLLEFAGEQGGLQDVTHGEFSGVQRVFVEDALHWTQAWLSAGTPLLLFVTYNCDAAHREDEPADVQSMLSTLRVSP